MGMQVTNHRFASLPDAKLFALAGNATLTLESLKTSAYYTFKIREKSEEGRPTVWFVNLLSGADNENDYRYLGLIRDGGSKFTLTRNSKITADAISYKAFTYFWNLTGDTIPDQLVVHHVGRCGRCGRTLTVPSSIQSGLGPDCRALMGLDL